MLADCPVLTRAIGPSNVKSMGFEVEVKYRSVDHRLLEQRLTALGASRAATIHQVDLYLNHPARDFAATNEAFRLRSIGDENRITYKGPRRPGPPRHVKKSRFALPMAPQAAAQLLQSVQAARVPLRRHDSQDTNVLSDE